MDTHLASKWHDLNATRVPPRILEIDRDILPGDWSAFCLRHKIRVYAVIGYENPVENMKIWPASGIVARGIERGEHRNTDTIIDSTSGNYGVALAAVVKELALRSPGFPIVRVASVVQRNLVLPKRKRLEAAGIQLFDADTALEAMDIARDLAAKNGWWYTGQYWNRDNPESYKPVAQHIAKRLPGLGVFACGVGSGGSCAGIMPELMHSFEGRGFGIQRLAVMVEKGQSVDGVRTKEAAEPGTLDWRVPTENVRYIAELPSLKFCAALWRQSWKSPEGDACFGGPSTGFVAEALMLELDSLETRRQLDGLRAEDGFVHTAFLSPDTRKPYREKYEQHGFYLRKEEWELPRITL